MIVVDPRTIRAALAKRIGRETVFSHRDGQTIARVAEAMGVTDEQTMKAIGAAVASNMGFSGVISLLRIYERPMRKLGIPTPKV